MEPVKLLERAACTAAHAVRHPISSAAYAAGIARGLAGAAVHGVRAHGEAHDSTAGTVPTQRRSESAAPSGPPEPQRVPKPVPPPTAAEDITVIEAEPPHESFATEPKAVSRESAHGGRATDAEIDAWIDEAVARGGDRDTEASVGTADDEPLLDLGVAKAIRKESEMLRKDAERDPE